jgi:Icc-related predicted phosphoesterase
VRILHTADLHYALRQFDWLMTQAGQFDIAVVAGDLLDLAGAVDLEVQEVVVQKYLRRFGGSGLLLATSGNHDIQQLNASGERTAAWLEEASGPTVLCDYESYEREGVLFSLCSWWDGPETRAKVERRLAEDAAKDKKWWIWLHHNPPAGSPVAWTGRKDAGDSVVVEWIRQYSPDIILSGHIHNAPFYEGGGWHAREGRTWIFNPGKQPGPEPARIILDLGARRADWLSLEGPGSVDL